MHILTDDLFDIFQEPFRSVDGLRWEVIVGRFRRRRRGIGVEFDARDVDNLFRQSGDPDAGRCAAAGTPITELIVFVVE